VDPRHFVTDPDADPDLRSFTSVTRIRMRIREAQKHTDPKDSD
jgi:hypothetical protein